MATAQHNMVAGGVVVDGETMSADITSKAVEMEGHTVAGVQIYSSSTGDRAGTIYVQESNDDTNWVNIQLNDDTLTTSTDIPVTASTEVSKLYNLAGLGCRFLRVKFSSSSGSTGTLTVYINKKK